jgi:hypothetical protein
MISVPQSLMAPMIAVCMMATTAMATTKTYENEELRYVVQLPEVCRAVRGPGTLEAICAPDLDAEKSKRVPAASAIVLEVDGEAVPSDAKSYTEVEFRSELPESVCGEGDASKVKLTNVRVDKDGERTTLTADVVCPELNFLRLPERRAEARTVLMPGFRYRLMVRYPLVDVDMAKPLSKAFFESFKLKPAGPR